jgi:hypothetical protein
MVIPKNKDPRIIDIHSIVALAFFWPGASNMGIPFEIASIPVNAEHPEEKALRRRNNGSDGYAI